MSIEDLIAKGTEVFKCQYSKMRFYVLDSSVWVLFCDTKWEYLGVPVYWGKSVKIENMVEYQKSIYKK